MFDVIDLFVQCKLLTCLSKTLNKFRFFRDYFTAQYAIQASPRYLLGRFGFGPDRPD